MAHHQHYRSPFGDTTLTKVFVGGLAWETPTDVMRAYFDQFGEILEAVIITDKNTAKSKGYGFVTFRDPESARRACADPNPMIDGRRANCNIASLGRPRPSPPRGRNQLANLYQGSGIAQGGGLSSYLPLPPPPPPPPAPPLIYPPYGYTSYSPDYAAYQQQQTMYNPHMQQTQYYTSSSALGSPYYYGYAPRGAFSMPAAQRLPGPSYLYYPTQVEGSSLTYPPTPHPNPIPSLQPLRHSLPSAAETVADLSAPPQTSTETEAGPATSTSSTTA